MRIKILTNGSVYTGSTAEQIVGQLWKAAFISPARPGDYMEDVARRILADNKTVVDVESASLFLSGLCVAGLIELDNEEDV